jgi:hypothetical protein
MQAFPHRAELPFFAADLMARYRRSQTTIPWGFALAVLATAGAPLRPCHAAETSRLWPQVVDLERKGRKTEALELLRRITSEEPSNLDAWNERAELEVAAGDLTSARISLERALEARPDVAVLSRNLEKVRGRQARLAYDSAFGTTGELPPLQLDALSGRSKADRNREVDSLRTALAGAQEEARKASRQRDSLQRLESDQARSGSTTQVAAVEPVIAPAPVPTPEPAPRTSTPASTATPGPATSTNTVPVRTEAKPSRPVLPARPAKLDPIGVVNWWAKTWSAQDVEAYIDCYASTFHPVGATHQEWMARRRERILAPKSIHVEVVSPKVVVSRAGHAEIVYRQVYQTESGKLTSRKRISLELLGGHWRIVGESEAR